MHILFYNYKGWVLKVVTSNIMDVKVNLGFRLEMDIRIRLCDFQNNDPKLEYACIECLRYAVENKRVVISPWRPPLKGSMVLCNVYVPCGTPVAEFAEAIEHINYDGQVNKYYLNISSYMNLCSQYGYNISTVSLYLDKLKLENVA